MNSKYETPTILLTFLALILTCLLVQKISSPAVAMSSDGTTSDHYTVLTGRSGQGSSSDPYEIVYVIDNYAGSLMIYYVENAQKPRSIKMVHSEKLSSIFRRAR